jgi:hypothetical protein
VDQGQPLTASYKEAMGFEQSIFSEAGNTARTTLNRYYRKQQTIQICLTGLWPYSNHHVLQCLKNKHSITFDHRF